MVTLPKPEVILTHESDLDGLLSGLLLQRLARHLYGIEVKLEAFHNHNWKQRPLKERAAWVTDFAFEARLDKPDWVVIDHHPSEAQPRHAQLIHNPSKSAALLCYDLCQDHQLGSKNLDRLVRLSNVADLFLDQDADFALASDYASLVKTYGFWTLRSLTGGDPEALFEHPLVEVMSVKRKVEDPIGFEWARQHVIEISPTVGLVQTLVGNTNLIMHRLLEEKAVPQAVLMTLLKRGNNMFVASLRSRNEEALKVAERLQGGGHPNAAGAVLPRTLQHWNDAVDYLRRVLDPKPAGGAKLNSLENAFNAVPGL